MNSSRATRAVRVVARDDGAARLDVDAFESLVVRAGVSLAQCTSLAFVERRKHRRRLERLTARAGAIVSALSDVTARHSAEHRARSRRR